MSCLNRNPKNANEYETIKLLTILTIVLILAPGCKKKSDNTSTDCTSNLDFNKITYTDEVGNTLSTDPADWTNDPVWCEKEPALFNTGNLNLTGGAPA